MRTLSSCGPLNRLYRFLGRFFFRRGMFWVGLAIVLCMTVAALFAPWLAPYDPTALHPKNILEAPCAAFPLGTDALGRDVLSRLLYGARVSLWVGFVSVSISVAIGVIFGLLSGYLGGLVDELIMRGVDVMLCFPSFFLILAVICLSGAESYEHHDCHRADVLDGGSRLVRAETLSLRERDFVAAAQLSGTGPLRIMFMHILPNALTPVLVSATLGVAGAILVESSLSFLGLGVQPPDPSWGNMLMEGKDVLEIAPWLSLYPGLAILVTVLGYNLLGESLRDTLDPRLKRR